MSVRDRVATWARGILTRVAGLVWVEVEQPEPYPVGGPDRHRLAVRALAGAGARALETAPSSSTSIVLLKVLRPQGTLVVVAAEGGHALDLLEWMGTVDTTPRPEDLH